MRLPLACLALALSAAAAAAPPAPRTGERLPVTHREVLPGGLELLVVPVPGAHQASLRYVVRAGSSSAPTGKAGLAHLLEHLVVTAPPGPDGAAGGVGLVEAARGAGAELNAFTGRLATTYALDAPAAAFPALAERYLRAVTSPQFPEAQLKTERGVVDREGDQRAGRGLVDYVEDAVFKVQLPEGSVLGDEEGRQKLSRDDLVSFFQRHYTTDATTVILAGAVTIEEARRLVARGVLLPPALPGEAALARAATPALPVTTKLRARFIATLVGYALAAEDREACAAVAAIVELRLHQATIVKEPLLRSVQVECLSLRGVDFVVAAGYSPTLQATDLPDLMEASFQDVSRRPVSPVERRLVEQRLDRTMGQLVDSPAALAGRLADAAERPREGGATEAPGPPTRLPAARTLDETVRRSFTPERRVLVHLSPFEG